MAHAVDTLGIAGVAPVSLEMRVSFFEPVRPGLVIVEGWVERTGKSTCFTEGVLQDPGGNVLAKASSTMRLASITKVAEVSAAALAGREP